MTDNDFYLVGLKVENSDKFYAIYQNRVYSFEQAKKIVDKLRSNNLGYKIYRIIGLSEVY